MPRLAREGDLDAVTATIALALRTDPVWGVALSPPAKDHLGVYWRYFVDAAHAQEGVWMLDGAKAVAVWVPPGAQELSDAQAARLAGFNLDTMGEASAQRLTELYERFESNHPHEEPHAYLSLLATHPDHRGQGIGQRLLRENLEAWDRVAVPSYLESTNPANDHRYERAGFRRVGGFAAVVDGAPIATMWRSVPR